MISGLGLFTLRFPTFFFCFASFARRFFVFCFRRRVVSAATVFTETLRSKKRILLACDSAHTPQGFSRIDLLSAGRTADSDELF